MGTRCRSELNYHKTNAVEHKQPPHTGMMKMMMKKEEKEKRRGGGGSGGGGGGGGGDDKTSLVIHSNRSLGNSPIR